MSTQQMVSELRKLNGQLKNTIRDTPEYHRILSRIEDLELQLHKTRISRN